MKNLELEGFGLVEMNQSEMLEIEGGGVLGALIGAVVAGALFIIAGGSDINGQGGTLGATMLVGAFIGATLPI